VSEADFAFSQQAFRRAAERLGIAPSALQGALWFAEKKLWHDRGWGELALGDFKKEMEGIPIHRKRYQERVKGAKEAPKKESELFDIQPRKK
jgi:hypothetical protein